MHCTSTYLSISGSLSHCSLRFLYTVYTSQLTGNNTSCNSIWLGNRQGQSIVPGNRPGSFFHL